MSNKIVQYVLVLAIIGVFIGLSFLATVSASINSALVTMASLLTLVAIVFIFSGGKK